MDRSARVVMISQPRYLPNLAYLHRISIADVLIMLDTVQYTPRDWENRNRIKSSSGPLWLSVPVLHESQTQRIIDTKIAGNPWQRKHLGSIQSCYGQAAHFDRYYPQLESILTQPWTHLAELNIALTLWLLKQLEIDVTLTRASAMPPVGSSGTTLLVELCAAAGGTQYLSGPLGRNYINAAEFFAAGIGLQYHSYVHPTYPQLHGDFYPHLSAIDLLFNVGTAAREVLNGANRVSE